MKSLYSLPTICLAIGCASATMCAQDNAKVATDVFKTNCATCHDAGADGRGPGRDVLRQMSPEQIFTALDKGAMARQAAQLSLAEKRLLAEFLSEKRFSNLPPNPIPSTAFCNNSESAFRDSLDGPAWNGWGVTTSNMRFQPAAGLSAADVPRLKLKWAFGFPGAKAVSGQPSIVAGRVFVSADNGYVYALSAATGCAYWSFHAEAVVRSSVTIERAAGKYAAYRHDRAARARICPKSQALSSR